MTYIDTLLRNLLLHRYIFAFLCDWFIALLFWDCDSKIVSQFVARLVDEFCCSRYQLLFYFWPIKFKRKNSSPCRVKIANHSFFYVFSIVLDHDECRTGNHDCQQKCFNLHGSYYCACLRGYQLNSDKITCSG